MNPLRAGRHRTSLTVLVLLGLTLAALLAVAWGSAAPAGAVTAPPCEAKLGKVAGKRAVINCGPATATLTIGGKTYHFSHGYCSDSKSAGAALSLDLGTLVTGSKTNGGEPYMSMLIPKASIDGSIFEADSGGKQVLGDSLITYSSNPMKGSFKSDHTDETFTGTWNCHGVLWHGP